MPKSQDIERPQKTKRGSNENSKAADGGCRPLCSNNAPSTSRGERRAEKRKRKAA